MQERKMRAKSSTPKTPAEKVVKDIRRATRKHYSAEDKIRIVLDGLRGEDSIAELCRREGIAQSMYYGWSKEFLEAGKRRLAGETGRGAHGRGGEGQGGRCGAGRGGEGAARGIGRAEGSRRRTGARATPSEKKHDRGGGRPAM